MRTSIVRFFLCLFSGDGAAYGDRLYLPAGLCDPGVSQYAHRVAWAPSPRALLADLHTRRCSRTQDARRAGPVDALHHHRVALWPPAESRLLERTSACHVVGAGVLGHLAT